MLPKYMRITGKGCKLIFLKVLVFCSGQNSSITKGNNFLIMLKRVMVHIHQISPHRDLHVSNIKVSSVYLLNIWLLCYAPEKV